MSPGDKLLVWLHGEISSPPFSKAARVEAGYLLRMLQNGETLPMPHSRPMPTIGARCHELRIIDETVTWRIIYRLDPDASETMNRDGGGSHGKSEEGTSSEKGVEGRFR